MQVEDIEEKFNALGRDPEKILRAYAYASLAHRGQSRESGEPFINHPLQVAGILTDLEADESTIIAALLHDVVEDTSLTLEDIQKNFGEEVAFLVDGLTKISALSYASKEERKVENLRKMFLAMARDVRVVLIKLADRLHNLRTLYYLPPEKQKEIAQETLEIYAPLASRLGIYKLKWEMEDLSFRYLDPQSYFDLAKKIQLKRSERERILNEAKVILEKKLQEEKIEAEIQYRAKHLYSVYQKMIKEGVPFEEIYDLLAMRVIVKEVTTCYEVLGLIHSLFKPLPGHLKDYIAMPKPNLYQSLHTVVIGPEGEPMEFQIRTWEMHKTAELGIAAHWRYKEGLKRDLKMEEKLAWLREILDWQKEMTDSQEFMERLQVDLFADEVLVFTPKGEIINLPQGSTPVDFAYKIHTQIGHHCAGAKVNGRIVPLDHYLKTGDRVEIITRANATPSPDWLQFVRATSTKGKIRAYFRQIGRDESIALGKNIFEKQIKKQLAVELPRLLEALNLTNEEELYLALGQAQITPSGVLSALKKPEQETLTISPPRAKGETVSTDGLIMRMAKCCHPLPGDEIVGYVTQGKGITIHRSNCPNVKNFAPQRLLEVNWPQGSKKELYISRLSVLVLNQPGVLKDITALIAEENINIQEIKAFPLSSAFAKIIILLEARNSQEVSYLINKLASLKVVQEITRA